MPPQYFNDDEIERRARLLARQIADDERTERMADDDERSQWHLDKKVPIGIILGIAIQTLAILVTGVTWKSDVDHRLESLERSDGLRQPQETRIVVVEQQLKYITQSLDRIEAKLERPATGAPAQ